MGKQDTRVCPEWEVGMATKGSETVHLCEFTTKMSYPQSTFSYSPVLAALALCYGTPGSLVLT